MAGNSEAYQPEHVKKSVAELHELINVAEQVTYDLAKSRSQVWKQIGFVSGVLTLCAALAVIFIFPRQEVLPITADKDTIFIVSCCFGLACLLAYLFAALIIGFNSRKWRLEREIVAEIIEIASGILDNVQRHIGSVEYTLLKMRLRRLGLSDTLVLGGLRIL